MNTSIDFSALAAFVFVAGFLWGVTFAAIRR
jgi:hypothetical protein